jgi:hypothetical protein
MEERHRPRCAACREDRLDLREHDLGDEGQLEPAGVGKGDPRERGELAAGPREILGVAVQAPGVGEKEPGVEASRPAGAASLPGR